jgi:hypothetical protein
MVALFASTPDEIIEYLSNLVKYNKKYQNLPGYLMEFPHVEAYDEIKIIRKYYLVRSISAFCTSQGSSPTYSCSGFDLALCKPVRCRVTCALKI